MGQRDLCLITSRMKERLTQQLLDGDLRSYLEEKEHWNAQHFKSIDWANYSSTFKRLSKGLQSALVKATHNLWHTGTRHQQYFGDAKPCCMRNCETEDWHHIIMCGSLDASLHRAASWGKLGKSMERWCLPPDSWMTIEKGINYYTEHPHKRTVNSKDNEPQKCSELHSPLQGTCCSRHSGHNHTYAGTIFIKVDSVGTG
jgi:hypothetical protein